MKTARLAVLGLALVAGLGAAWLIGGSHEPAPAPVAAPAPAPVENDDVLVAARDLTFGTTIVEADVAWQKWPKANIPPNAIVKSASPKAIDDVKGSIVRSGFSQGDLLRRERLIKGPNAGFLSAILAPGTRAVAISVDPGGNSAAGGFILPNDRVDVLQTYRDEEAAKNGSSDALITETILTNIRVLAIGQNIQEKNGQSNVAGSNATLELTPRQAETVVQAQKRSGGNLTLALRPMTETAGSDEVPQQQQSMTVIRYGLNGAAGKGPAMKP